MLQCYGIIGVIYRHSPRSYHLTCKTDGAKARTGRSTIPKFVSFAEFIKTEVKIATDPVFTREALKVQDFDSGFRRKTSNYRIKSNTTKVCICVLCNNDHDLDDCKEFLKKTVAERRSFAIFLEEDSFALEIKCY